MKNAQAMMKNAMSKKTIAKVYALNSIVLQFITTDFFRRI
jgi:hypothetical protein